MPDLRALPRIRVDVAQQTLTLETVLGVHTWPVSTAVRGVGETKGSFQTPRGRHIVRAMIGAGQPLNSVFVGRRPSGEIYTPELGQQGPERDWILTRILWLSGCEAGFNRLGDCDTMQRYIYIHGTPDESFVARPASHGCIRMKNADIVALFERIRPGTPVEIVA